jgi:hypothetical protein
MYPWRRNHDKLVQEGCNKHGKGEKEERETRGETTKSASKRAETYKVDAVLQPEQQYKSY